jgi:hypothetical protein
VDTLWISSIGASLVLVLTVALVLLRSEGRAKVYYSTLLFSFALLALVSLTTALGTDVAASLWFKLPRTLVWTAVALAALRAVLYQLNILNGTKAE